jgi:membrane-associated phospholipid phosphatase
LINAETFAVNEFLTMSVSNVLTRKRPQDAECQDDPNCVRSFWSGHDANAFAAASLVCVEHGALPLYGGISDDVACGTALAAASAVGLLRVAADDHYASDVIVGAAIGGATGYLMPKLLHFRSKKSRNKYGDLFPKVGPRGGGLTYVKAW